LLFIYGDDELRVGIGCIVFFVLARSACRSIYPGQLGPG
jgi:hypothetical protein